jgi:hypothetical protein
MSNEVKEEVNNEGFDDSNERWDDDESAAYDANVNEDADGWIFEDAGETLTLKTLAAHLHRRRSYQDPLQQPPPPVS